MGGVTDTLVLFAKEQVRPKVLEMFQQRGIYLQETHCNVRVTKNGKFLLEINLVLVNTIYAIVVKVKQTLRQNDVEDHLERLTKLQQAEIRSIKETIMYGAVAGMSMKDEVKLFAIKKGYS